MAKPKFCCSKCGCQSTKQIREVIIHVTYNNEGIITDKTNSVLNEMHREVCVSCDYPFNKEEWNNTELESEVNV